MGVLFSKITSLFLLAVCLTACGSSGFQDLDEFMAEKKSRPAGVIKPIPPFKAYKAFTYGATALRSPFDPPVEVREITQLQLKSTVKPDENRTKEFLEQFSLDSLKMVGTLKQGSTQWALVQNMEGGVFRVKEGNYLGRNHGRIVETSDTYLSVIEIVPNGVDGWIERPRTIKLTTKD